MPENQNFLKIVLNSGTIKLIFTHWRAFDFKPDRISVTASKRSKAAEISKHVLQAILTPPWAVR